MLDMFAQWLMRVVVVLGGVAVLLYRLAYKLVIVCAFGVLIFGPGLWLVTIIGLAIGFGLRAISPGPLFDRGTAAPRRDTRAQRWLEAAERVAQGLPPNAKLAALPWMNRVALMLCALGVVAAIIASGLRVPSFALSAATMPIIGVFIVAGVRWIAKLIRPLMPRGLANFLYAPRFTGKRRRSATAPEEPLSRQPSRDVRAGP